jgi:hypothetical protein
MTPPKHPPPGVETTPGGSVVPLKEAATRLKKDPRTLIRAITNGEIRGGAMPRPERLRWYVYADELPQHTEPLPSPPDARLEDLRAQVVSLSEANRLLIAAQQELLQADQLKADASDKYRTVARLYSDALLQFMTPGHLGELTDSL